MRLRDLGENGLINRIRERFQTSAVPLGIGDDAAVLDIPAGDSLLFCSDLVAEETHFIRGLHPADSVGYKAVAVNVSDIGAMGGVPMCFLISLAAPGELELGWVDDFYSGVERACAEFGVSLVGGDTSSSNAIFIDISMIGRVRAGGAILRSGAQLGDSIYVTGRLGASMLGLELLRAGQIDAPAVQRHLYPQPRYRVGAAVANLAHAMIDISDGLSTDLNHIVTASSVSAKIFKERLPAAEGASETHVIHGGEEYELIITASDLPAQIGDVPLTCIGEIVPTVKEHQVSIVDGRTESVLQPRGWDHYKK
jgi:thiamine-monophosphate kinase